MNYNPYSIYYRNLQSHQIYGDKGLQKRYESHLKKYNSLKRDLNKNRRRMASDVRGAKIAQCRLEKESIQIIKTQIKALLRAIEKESNDPEKLQTQLALLKSYKPPLHKLEHVSYEERYESDGGFRATEDAKSLDSDYFSSKKIRILWAEDQLLKEFKGKVPYRDLVNIQKKGGRIFSNEGEEAFNKYIDRVYEELKNKSN